MEKQQLKKFKEAAKEHGCAESAQSFDEKLGKLAQIKPKPEP